MTLAEVFGEFFRREGGWGKITDHPADLGGLTHSGVTMRSFNVWRAGHGERVLTAAEFVQTTRPQHEAFLEDTFVRPFAFVTDEAAQALLVDWAMHAGVDDPTEAMQERLALRDLYRGAIDGVPGPMTRAGWLSLATAPDELRAVERELVRARIEFHVDKALDKQAREFIRTHKTTQLTFLRGWVRRGLEFV